MPRLELETSDWQTETLPLHHIRIGWQGGTRTHMQLVNSQSAYQWRTCQYTWWAGKDSNLQDHKAPDLQSGTLPITRYLPGTQQECDHFAAPILQHIEALSASMSCIKRFQVVKDHHLQLLADDPGTKKTRNAFHSLPGFSLVFLGRLHSMQAFRKLQNAYMDLSLLRPSMAESAGAPKP